MAKADLGLKRTCLSCGMRFYDFNRTPIVCPGCQTEFDPEAVIRSRRGRAAPKPSEKDDKAAKGEMAEEPAVQDDEDQAVAVTSADNSGEGDDLAFEDDDIPPGIPNDDE